VAIPIAAPINGASDLGCALLGACGLICVFVGGEERVNTRNVVYVVEGLVMDKMIVRVSDDILKQQHLSVR
jgi:hypothetical protein